jgi:hypothetical protein
VVISKSNNGWALEKIAEKLGEDYYYPYVIPNAEDVHVLSIQDTCYPEMTEFDYPCFYQFVSYHYNNHHFKVVDYSDHPISDSRPQLMEHIDFYQDKSGRIHILTRAWLTESYEATFDYIVIDETPSIQDTAYIDVAFNWLRLFEVGNDLYIIGNTYNKLAFIHPESGKVKYVSLDVDISGCYLYINAPRSGSHQDFLDVYLVAADPNEYTGKSYYLRFDHQAILEFLK